MARMSYGSKAGRVLATKVKDSSKSVKSPEEVVRELKQAAARSSDETYRERALALYGLICARCGREFDNAHRQLLTIHHKDGNHHNNPPDGSNWEPLCVYCHEDAHSRDILGNYMDGAGGGRESELVYRDKTEGNSILGDKLRKALENKTRSRS